MSLSISSVASSALGCIGLALFFGMAPVAFKSLDWPEAPSLVDNTVLSFLMTSSSPSFGGSLPFLNKLLVSVSVPLDPWLEQLSLFWRCRLPWIESLFLVESVLTVLWTSFGLLGPGSGSESENKNYGAQSTCPDQARAVILTK